MISFCLQEHEETQGFVKRMLDLVAAIQQRKEMLIATSASYEEFMAKYGSVLKMYDLPIRVFGGIDSCGAARNVCARNAIGEDIIFCDMHVCFTEKDVSRLLATLAEHKNAVVGPAIQPGEFPSCEASPGGKAHGVAFRFVDRPWEWVWIPADTTEHEFHVPFVCGCAYAMKKQTFNLLARYGGFLHSLKGLGAEEEFGMRLWRVGGGVYIEPRAVFLHYFKGYSGHAGWDEHSTSGFYESRVAAIYINVFERDLFEHIAELCEKHWGAEWDKNLRIAGRRWNWLRDKLEPYRDRIDEKWFFRIA